MRYTVPALQLRRMLAEARTAGAPFELVYTVLDGDTGDEKWRGSSAGRGRIRALGALRVRRRLRRRQGVRTGRTGPPAGTRDVGRSLGCVESAPYIVAGMSAEMHCAE